ncbi:hypothetical protein PVK06_005062 [Gossypium arboreum]|uniref:Uncharacterized protein n=1 Tax=Gossypium arboreum TaxID=29729 RepID=A0ABR0QTM8_GOSAR|nr:hypothetical protein PVK06_005062 [Gossypium arboreum]
MELKPPSQTIHEEEEILEDVDKPIGEEEEIVLHELIKEVAELVLDLVISILSTMKVKYSIFEEALV